MSAEVTPRSAAVSSSVYSWNAIIAMPKSRVGTQRASTTTCEITSVSAMIVCDAPAQATPRFT